MQTRMVAFACRMLFALLTFNATTVNSISDEVASYFGGIDLEGYLEWLQQNDIASRYPNSMFLSSANNPDKGVALHWKIEGEHFHLALAAKASGFVGFGIAEVGGMLGSDIVYFEASRPDRLVDAHVLEKFYPLKDYCQHWNLVDSHFDNDFIMFEGQRLLDTGDLQDHVISEETPSRIIAAWGDAERIGYHGSNVARGIVRLGSSDNEGEAFRKIMEDASSGYFDIFAENYEIGGDKTQYINFLFSQSDLIKQGVPEESLGLNIIGFEPLIQQGSEPFVHHFVLQASPLPESENAALETIFSWTPGTTPWALDDNLGMPLFGIDGYKSFQLAMHYDNSYGVLGHLDSSGVRLHYTNKPRQYALGSLTIADPFVVLRGQSIGEGLTSHTFHVNSECTKDIFNEHGPITIVKEIFHMHHSGVRMENTFTRDGRVVNQASIEVWDFDQQGAPATAREHYVLKPGDEMTTTCYYRNNGGTLSFGIASEKEMCMSQLFYYPKLPYPRSLLPLTAGLDLPRCVPSYANTTLKDETALQRRFGASTSTVCGDATAPYADSSKSWEDADFIPKTSSSKQPLLSSSTLATRTWIIALSIAVAVPCVLLSFVGMSQTASQTWTRAVRNGTHRPILAILRRAAKNSAQNPAGTILFLSALSIILFAAGFFTNFHYERDEAILWAPSGSLMTKQGNWISHQFETENEDVEGARVFKLLFHNNGENVLHRNALVHIFETLDKLEGVQSYSSVCSTRCPVRGATQFWDSEKELFLNTTDSEESFVQTISYPTFPDGNNVVDADVFGYAQRDRKTVEHRLLSVLSYRVEILLPDSEETVKLEYAMLDQVLALNKQWGDQFQAVVRFPGSYENETRRAILEDIFLIPIAFVLLLLYTSFVFVKSYGSRSKGWLGIGAVASCLVSIAFSMGLMFLCGVKVTILTPSLIFIVLGIGVDDAFILMGAFVRQDPTMGVVERISETIDNVGISMTVTSLTSSLAFALGSLSTIPAVRWLCLYASVMIMADFLFQITFFVALIALDDHQFNRKQIDDGPKEIEEDTERLSDRADAMTGKEGASVEHPWDRFVDAYANWLLRPRTKLMVLFSFMILSGVATYGTFQMKQGFSLDQMLPKGSFAGDYEIASHEYSSEHTMSPVAYFRSVDPMDIESQKRMAQFVRELIVDGPFENLDQACWFNVINAFPMDTIDRENVFSYYEEAFSKDDGGIVRASRCPLSLSVGKKDSVEKAIETFEWIQAITERQAVNQESHDWWFFTYSTLYQTWEFFATCKYGLMTTSVGTVAAISFVASLFIPHWSALLYIVPMAIIIYIDLVGVLYWAGILINPLSYVTLVVCIGVSTDYVIHVLTCFHEARGSRKEKAINTIQNVGTSILLSGLSSLLGISPLFFSTSSVGFTFCVAFFGFVALGLVHGLVLMPVILTTFGTEEKELRKTESLQDVSCIVPAHQD